MKKYFLTGLAVLLPLALTILIVIFLFNLLTEPFAGLLKGLLGNFYILEMIPEKIQQFINQIIILIFLFFFTVFLGFVGRWLFINYIIRASEHLLQRIPFIRAVYNTSKDVIKTLFTSTNKSFQQVVLVPYPNATTFCIGLVTREDMRGLGSTSDEQLVAVFVPCTPNPTSGFLMMFAKDELIYLSMSVEDAFKYIISCGVITVPFNLKSANEKEETP
jgi:uncharacterized membrane protein